MGGTCRTLTSASSHSFLFFTEILSAFIALRVFVWVRTDSPTDVGSLVAGLATGYLLLVHTRNIGLVAALMALAVYRSRRWTDGTVRLTWFVLGATALIVFRTIVIHHFWGTWVMTPLATVDATYTPRRFLAEFLTRIAGWLVDREHGLLPYAPLYILVPTGWWQLWRRHPDLCVELTWLVAAYVGLMAIPTLNTTGWTGGWAPAARFLVPIAPLLGICVFSAIADSARLPRTVLVVAALQIGLDAVLWQHPGLLWNGTDGTSVLFSYLGGVNGPLVSWAPSLLPPIRPRTVAVIAGIMAAWAVFTASLVLPSKDHRSR
jgi:hypothetical protein